MSKPSSKILSRHDPKATKGATSDQLKKIADAVYARMEREQAIMMERMGPDPNND